MWAVPFLVTPPLFSRDVYSYLAVGQMMRLGLNPYDSGPYDVLGDTDPFAHQVDAKMAAHRHPVRTAVPADRPGHRHDQRAALIRRCCCSGSSNWSAWR